jgi:large subunit ribosomal protein L4
MIEAITRWGVDIESKVLMIVADRDENLFLSVRNVRSLKLITATNLNVFDLLNADSIIATEGALAKVQEVYGA